MVGVLIHVLEILSDAAVERLSVKITLPICNTTFAQATYVDL